MSKIKSYDILLLSERLFTLRLQLDIPDLETLLAASGLTMWLEWLWHNWQSSHLQYQTTRVRAKPSATFIKKVTYRLLPVEKTKIKKMGREFTSNTSQLCYGKKNIVNSLRARVLSVYRNLKLNTMQRRDHSANSATISVFLKPHFHPSGFYLGHQCSWILTSSQSV